MFLNEQLRRMLSRYVRGQQPMTADENTWLTRILVDYYDRDLARDLLKEPPPGATEEEAKSYKTIYGTVESLDEVFRIMQSHQDAASQARLVNETTRKILEQFLTGGEDNTPDAVRSFLMSNPNFSNVTKPEFEALVKNISKQVEETYRNRARTIARTELAIAQSKTVAQELRAQGKTHVRIYDGLGCGWRHHDDGDYANGSLRRIEDYLNYPVAHPNCVRAGYPDFFGGDGSIHVGKKDLDLFAVAADRLKGQQTKSLEAVSANQKSLDGVSNRPDGSGGPLDLLEGSETARKYNPNHSPSNGQFISGPGAGPTGEEAVAFLKDHDSGFMSSLSASEKDTVSDYRSENSNSRAMMAELDGVMKRAPKLKQDTTVYRRVTPEVASRYTAGQTYTDKAFTSASLRPEGTLKSQAGQESTILALRASQGTRAAAIGIETRPGWAKTNTLLETESELLFPRNTSFEILGVATKTRALKYNPNHDRLGRFATGSAGGAFTEEDKAAVSTYLKPQKAAWSEEVNHRAINDQLRGMAEHDRPDVSDAITKLDAAFAHGDTIPAGTELYRGIPGLRLSEVYKVGDTFTDYGFSSHSKNEGEAFDFITGRAQMGTANSRATGTLLKAKVTQPTKAIDVAQHFDDPLYKREQEVLLNRGTKFRVTEIYTGPMADIEDVIVEVVR